MRAIQTHLPNPRHIELHRIAVNASPADAWQAARHFDGGTIPWVRALFDLRTLPARLLGKPVDDVDRRIGIDPIIDRAKGFLLIEERPGEEVVVGAVGQFWHLDIPFKDVSAAEFAGFQEPGWGKVAWCIRVEPRGEGSWVSLELRTTATDDESWNKQVNYFRLIGPFSHLIRTSMMAHLEAELGKAEIPSDSKRTLPGDEHIADARYSLTHAVDIEAPPSMVWPWLMQLGCDRGGWYSIDALDHGGEPSVEHLEVRWSERHVGDKLSATPAQDGFYDVLQVQPEALFLIGGETDRLGGHIKTSWSFVLERLGSDATHLVTRVRAVGVPRWSEWLQGAVIFPPIHALMQHAQLKNLKRLAEQNACLRPAPASEGADQRAAMPVH